MPICAPVVKKETRTSQQAHVMHRFMRSRSNTILCIAALLVPIQGLQAKACDCASKAAKSRAPSQCAVTCSDAPMLHRCCGHRGVGETQPEKSRSCCSVSGKADRGAQCGCSASCCCRDNDPAPSPAVPAPPVRSRVADDLVQQCVASFCFAATDCDGETGQRPLPVTVSNVPATALKRCISLSRLTL